MAVPAGGVVADVVLAGAGGIRAPAEVFQRIFLVFLALGTLVGTVVITYTLYNAYKYRYREDVDPAPDAERPQMGELPEGGGKGKKLFLSFGLSAVIVLSLVAWTYGALVMVEDGPDVQSENLDSVDVHVEGYQFGWEYTYPNGATATTLRVPVDTVVNVSVTSRDVFHNFGIPELRIKTDAIPGQTNDAWFVAEETGTYTANCYELCGQGHSYMQTDVVVMSQSAYQDWYSNTNGTQAATNGTGGNTTEADL